MKRRRQCAVACASKHKGNYLVLAGKFGHVSMQWVAIDHSGGFEIVQCSEVARLSHKGYSAGITQSEIAFTADLCASVPSPHFPVRHGAKRESSPW